MWIYIYTGSQTNSKTLIRTLLHNHTLYVKNLQSSSNEASIIQMIFLFPIVCTFVRAFHFVFFTSWFLHSYVHFSFLIPHTLVQKYLLFLFLFISLFTTCIIRSYRWKRNHFIWYKIGYLKDYLLQMYEFSFSNKKKKMVKTRKGIINGFRQATIYLNAVTSSYV